MRGLHCMSLGAYILAAAHIVRNGPVEAVWLFWLAIGVAAALVSDMKKETS